MTQEQPERSPSLGLESRIIASILDEASDFEKAQFEEILGDDKSLLTFRDSMQRIHQLLVSASLLDLIGQFSDEELAELESSGKELDDSRRIASRITILQRLEAMRGIAASSSSLQMGEQRRKQLLDLFDEETNVQVKYPQIKDRIKDLQRKFRSLMSGVQTATSTLVGDRFADVNPRRLAALTACVCLLLFGVLFPIIHPFESSMTSSDSMAMSSQSSRLFMGLTEGMPLAASAPRSQSVPFDSMDAGMEMESIDMEMDMAMEGDYMAGQNPKGESSDSLDAGIASPFLSDSRPSQRGTLPQSPPVPRNQTRLGRGSSVVGAGQASRGRSNETGEPSAENGLGFRGGMGGGGMGGMGGGGKRLQANADGVVDLNDTTVIESDKLFSLKQKASNRLPAQAHNSPADIVQTESLPLPKASAQQYLPSASAFDQKRSTQESETSGPEQLQLKERESLKTGESLSRDRVSREFNRDIAAKIPDQSIADEAGMDLDSDDLLEEFNEKEGGEEDSNWYGIGLNSQAEKQTAEQAKSAASNALGVQQEKEPLQRKKKQLSAADPVGKQNKSAVKEEFLKSADSNQADREAIESQEEKITDNASDTEEASETVPQALDVSEIKEAFREVTAAQVPFSTFSLHVSDVSFKLARASLERGQWPDSNRIRIEEFVNAIDYGDPIPSQTERVACRIEQAIHPFLQQRNLLRVSMRTAATGRASGTPLRITFLLDNSGSMERIDRRQTVRRAFQVLAGQLQPGDEVNVISFASQPRLLAERLQGKQAVAILGMLDQIPSEGGTNLESALMLAGEKAREHFEAGAQNRIVLITDGAVNLGDADPLSLSNQILSLRESGIAFDAAGIGADGLNDEVLEALTRKGDGRYYLLDSAESVDEGFANQIAGALRPAAKNVKIQIEFNPQRVGMYKLLGFEKHRLKTEDFRNDQVDAAELAAAEAGVAVYQVQVKPDGFGDIGSVSVRFQDLKHGRMVEERWPITYDGNPSRIEDATESMKLASASALFAMKLKDDERSAIVDLAYLRSVLSTLSTRRLGDSRVEGLRKMMDRASQMLSGSENN